MSKHASPTVVGAFVVVGIALAIAGVFVFGGGRYFHETTRVIVYFEGSVAGLRVGAPVKFRGIDIGTVRKMRINMSGAVRDPQHIRIPVVLEIDEDQLRAQGVTNINLGDRTQVAELVGQGLRAELATDSLVTGVLYVSLDVRPDTPARLVNDPTYPEIPPARTARETIPANFDVIMMKLADVDFGALASSLQNTIDHVDQLASSPNLTRAVSRLDDLTRHVDELSVHLGGTIRELRPAVTQLKNAATAAGKALEPAGHLANQLDNTMHDLQLAARSVRRLSDQISRDPGSLLRGGRQ